MSILQQFYSAQSVESSILLADNDDCLYGDLYDVLKALDYEEEVLLLPMAPGCLSKNQADMASSSKYIKDQQQNNETTFCEINLDQIPLPSTPPPSLHGNDDQADDFAYDDEVEHEPVTTLEALVTPVIVRCKKPAPPPLPVLDVLDSFEILEQTVRKQKRLAKKKNTDMRMKVLLKRTFDLVCEIMDHENGFDDDDELINVAKQQQQQHLPAPPPPPPPQLPPTSTVVLEINIKHNDYADEVHDYNNTGDSNNNVVPSTPAAIKRSKPDDDDEEDDDDDEDDSDEESTAPRSTRSSSKRQKFTSETSTAITWCKDENESLFDMMMVKCEECDDTAKNSDKQQLFSSTSQQTAEL